MKKGDKASLSIILAGRALLVKMFITLEPRYTFGSNFEYLFFYFLFILFFFILFYLFIIFIIIIIIIIYFFIYGVAAAILR